VLPAQVTITQVGVASSTSLPAEASRIGDALPAVVKGYLKSKGASILEPATNESADERAQLAEIQQRYDVVDLQMLKHPKGVVRGRYTLGDVVAAYPPAASADTLVFIRGHGKVTTLFQKAIGTAPGPWMWLAKSQFFDGRIAFVDARSGEVLLLLLFATSDHGWKQSVEELLPRIKDAALLMVPPIHEVVGPR